MRGGLARISVYAVRCFCKQLILLYVSAHKSIRFVIGAFLLARLSVVITCDPFILGQDAPAH